MDAESEEMTVQASKLRQLPSSLWYVHCKWCDEEARLQAPNEDEACRMLDEWRLSMPCRPSKERFWSCPTCAEGHQDPKPTTTDTAESASEEVRQLKAEVVELKAEVDKWKELVHRHVAYKAAHVDEIRKLRQEIDQLRAQATAVPDDDPSSHEG